MAAPTLNDVFHFAHVLKTTVSSATKKILAQTGSVVGQGQTDGDNVEWVQHVGFASLPPNPVAGKETAQAFVVRAGGIDTAIASQDLRGLALYGNLKPGETCIYACGADGNAQARILLKADGSINFFTKKGNTSSGSGMGVFINSDGSVSITGTEGNAVLLGSDGSVKVFNASGGFQIKQNGDVKIASSGKVEISGASITLGGTAALPLAIAPQVVTAISALQTQVTAVANALVAVAGIAGPVGGAHATAAAAATAAVASGASAVSTASSAIPTKRVSAD